MRPIPHAIRIDASAHCQLACPSCPTTSGATKAAMSAGHLDPARFEALLDATPEIAEVELSNYGEMFLNPKLTDLLRIAFERKVVIHANNGVNFNHVSPETLEALVQYRLRSMTVSIDGVSPKTYSRYRVKGDFDRVIGHIRQLNDLKRRHRTAFPLLAWQFIVFGHNEHEIDAAKRLATELAMTFKPKISWDDEFSPVRDPQLVQLKTGLSATREEHYRSIGADYVRSICYQLWTAPVLNWDGRLLGCCRNFWGDFGANAFTEGLPAALDSPRLQNAREALMGRAPMNPEVPCATCDLYLTMQRDGKWISREELARTANPGRITSIVMEPGDSPATHVDVFVAPGHHVNRLLLARPPQAQRVDLSRQYFTLFPLPAGDYTIYALPKQLDPTFRKQFPALPPLTVPVKIAERPWVQEFHLELAPEA
jgi:hypothetical protein